MENGKMEKNLTGAFMKRISYFLLTGFIFMNYACNKDSVSKDDYSSVSDYRIKRMVHYSSSTSDRETMGVEYTYDNSGNLIKESYYDYYPQKVLYMYREYKYSANKKIREDIYDGTVYELRLGLYSIFHYTDGNLTKEEVFSGYDNSYIHSLNYEYDSRNNLVRRYHEMVNDIASDVRYSYNDKNRLILEENTASGSTEYKYIKYIYDDKDREIKQEYYNIDWQLLYYVSKIYENGSSNPSEEFHSAYQTRYRHYYDQWDNLEETVINDSCSLFRRTYNGKLLIESINYNVVWGCVESGMTKYEYDKVH
jgi:hypothetical protein